MAKKEFSIAGLILNESYIRYRGIVTLFDSEAFLYYCLCPKWLIDLEYQNVE
jgi:hypothetical protein